MQLISVGRSLLFLSLCLILLSCTGGVGKNQSPSGWGNGIGFGGNSPSETPGPDAGDGRNLISLTNGGVRCGFKDSLDGYEIKCKAVVKTKNVEVKPDGVLPGTEFIWDTLPKVVEGTKIRTSTCKVSPEDIFAMDCYVVLEDSGASRIKFSLNLNNQPVADEVHVPFSVKSYGEIFQLGASEDVSTSAQKTVGHESTLADPLNVFIGHPKSLCRIGNRIYVAADQQIYAIENGKVSLYAGSTNRSNVEVFTHRLRIAMGRSEIESTGTSLELFCSAKDLFVRDFANQRILILPDDGPVSVLPMPKEYPFYGFWRPLRFPPALDSGDSGFFFVDYAKSSVMLLKMDGTLKVVMSVPTDSRYQLSYAYSIALSKQGNLFFYNNFAIYKVAKNGTVTRLMGQPFKEGYEPGTKIAAMNAFLGLVSALDVDESETVFFLERDSKNIRPTRLRSINSKGILVTERENLPAYSDPTGTMGYWGRNFSSVGFGMAYGHDKFVYLYHPILRKIYRVSPTVSQKELASSELFLSDKIAEAPSSSDSVPTTDLRNLSGLAIGPDGGVYFSEPFRRRIMKVDLNTGTLSRIAGLESAKKLAPGALRSSLLPDGSLAFMGDGGPATESDVGVPQALVFKGNDLYFAQCEKGAPHIRKIDSNGIISTYLRTQNCAFKLINAPDGGFIYSSRTEHNVIRIYPNGLEKVLVAGGSGTSSILFAPNGIALSPEGNLYIANTGNGSIVRLATIDGLSTPEVLFARPKKVKGSGAGSRVEVPVRNPTGLTPVDLPDLQSPMDITPGIDGTLLVTGMGTGRIISLTPIASGEWPYFTAKTLLGAPSDQECSGSFRGSLDRDDLEASFRTSLSSLCQAQPTMIRQQGTCAIGADNRMTGEVRTVFIQMVGSILIDTDYIAMQNPSNIIETKYACRR